jgi:hypothetical protein
VCFFLFGFWGFFCVFLFVKTYKTILRTHIDKNIQNNPQNSYRQKHTKQSSEPI